MFAGAVAVWFALLGLSLPAAAQSLDPISGYASLGYSDIQAAKITNSAMTARLGARLWSYFGIEGEASVGVNDDRFLYSVPCPPVSHSVLEPSFGSPANCATPKPSMLSASCRLDQISMCSFVAVWGPHYSALSDPTNGFNEQSSNYGLGGDYFSLAQMVCAWITRVLTTLTNIIRSRVKRSEMARMSGQLRTFLDFKAIFA